MTEDTRPQLSGLPLARDLLSRPGPGSSPQGIVALATTAQAHATIELANATQLLALSNILGWDEQMLLDVFDGDEVKRLSDTVRMLCGLPARFAPTTEETSS